MSNEDFRTGKELKHLFQDFKEYLELKYDIIKLDMSEKLVLFFSSFYSFFVLLVLIPFALFFLSLAGAFYLGEILNSIVLGFSAVGAAYFILILLFILFKDLLITRPLVRTMIDMFFKKGDK